MPAGKGSMPKGASCLACSPWQQACPSIAASRSAVCNSRGTLPECSESKPHVSQHGKHSCAGTAWLDPHGRLPAINRQLLALAAAQAAEPASELVEGEMQEERVAAGEHIAPARQLLVICMGGSRMPACKGSVPKGANCLACSPCQQAGPSNAGAQLCATAGAAS